MILVIISSSIVLIIIVVKVISSIVVIICIIISPRGSESSVWKHSLVFGCRGDSIRERHYRSKFRLVRNKIVYRLSGQYLYFQPKQSDRFMVCTC